MDLDTLLLIGGVRVARCVYYSELIEHIKQEKFYDKEAFDRHIQAYIDMLDFADTKQPISFIELLNWHDTLFPPEMFLWGGTFRTGEAKIKRLDSNEYYIPPKGQDVIINYLTQWVDQANQFVDNPHDVWHNLADLHLFFENIHPYAEGNGRAGRLVLNWLAYRALGKLVCIHFKDRPTYIRALENNDVLALSKLIKGRTA